MAFRLKWPKPPPYFGPEIYSNAMQFAGRTLRYMPPPPKPKETWDFVKFPIIEIPPDLEGTVGGWELVTKPRVRPYYVATVRFMFPIEEFVTVRFIVDPDDTTPDHEIQARIDERMREVAALIRRKQIDA